MFDDPEVYGGVLAAIAAAVVSTIALVSIVFVGDWGKRNSAYFSSFAVGYLLIAIAFHIIPEALEASPDYAWTWLFAGLIVVTIISQAIRILSRSQFDSDDLAIGFASIVALGAHSLIDGLVYEAIFVDLRTGLIGTAGLILHEIPEAVIAYFLVRETGVSKLTAGLIAFVAASLTTIGGALLAAWTLRDVAAPPLGMLLGLSAGALAYITIVHLGANARLATGGKGYLWAGIGVALSTAAVVFEAIFLNGGH